MLLKQTLLYLPAQVLTPLSQLAAVVIWAHFIDVRAIGLLTLLIAVQEISFAVLLRWWAQYVLRFVNASTTSRKTFLQTEAFIVYASMAISILIGYVCSKYYLRLESENYAIICAVFFASRSLVNYISDRARSEQLITLYSVVQILSFVGGLTLGIMPILFRGIGFIDIVIGYTVAQLLSLILAIIFMDFGRALPKLHSDIFKGAATYGLPVMLSQSAGALAINAPRFIVERFFGLETAGVFSIAYTIGIRIANFAVTLVTPAAFPLAARKLREEGLSAALLQLQHNMIFSYMVIIASTFGMIAINNVFIQLFMPAQIWTSAHDILPLAVLVGMLRFMRTHATDQIFMLTSKQNTVLGISLVDCVLCAALGSAFALAGGATGVTIGAIASGGLTLVASQLAAWRLLSFSTPIASIMKLIIAGFAMLVSVRMFVDFVDANNIVKLVSAICLGAAVYSGLVALFLRKELRVILRPGA